MDPGHGYRLSDFTNDDISHLIWTIRTAMDKENPMEWMDGYIQGCMMVGSSGIIPDDVILLDIFWSYLHQGGHEGTTPGHIGLGPYSTSDVCNEVIDHLIDNDLIHMDLLLDFISTNIRK